MHSSGWLHNLLNTGVRSDIAEADARRIVLLNAVSLCTTAASIAGLCVPKTYSEPVFFLTTFMMLVVGVGVLLLHRARAPGLAATLFLVAGLGILLSLAVFVSPHAGHVVFLFPVVALPWLIIGSGRQIYALIISLLSAGLYSLIIRYYNVGFDIRAMSTYIGKFSIYNQFITGGLFVIIGYYSRNIVVSAELGLEHERKQSQNLVYEMLPRSVAERVSSGTEQFADRIGDASILFASFCNFSAAMRPNNAEELIRLLDELFSEFDDLCQKFGIEKIKSSGEQYMVAAGLTAQHEDHAERLVRLAIEMQRAVVGRCTSSGEAMRLRIGINSGPVVAGVIGKSRLSFDVWGDTVNTAQRMEANSGEGDIRVSPITYAKVNHKFICEAQAMIPIKGKDPMRTYLIKGPRRTRTSNS